MQIIPKTAQAEIETPPLVFEFEQPPELVETPEEARLDHAPDNAQFRSDKNARAQDEYADNNLPNGMSYNEGETDYLIFKRGGEVGQQMEAQQAEQQNESMGQDEQENQEEMNDDELADNGTLEITSNSMNIPVQQRKFSKNILYGQQTNPTDNPNTFSDDLSINNRQSSAENLGGISLSTYEWEYGPYLLYLKKRVRDHVYPPAAFYQMGVIQGEVLVKFTIYRDGSINEPVLLKSSGHEAFISTSINAIKGSSPLKKLPDSFPNKELELTWTFIYTIYR